MKQELALHELPPGAEAVVKAVGGEGAVRRRLLELGLAPGTRVRCVGESPCGDPRAYKLRGAVLALRRRDSGAIRVEAEAGGGEAEIALVGNPNVGKSTLFNRLTGLRQHTGNWPGKTVERAEGRCRSARRAYRLVDLPGCYSLLARSPEERVTRDYLRAGRADAVIVVCDASSLERNLPLALQTAELCPRMLLCVNLMDEAARRGVTPDLERLEKELGAPVLGITAHERVSRRRVLDALDALLDAPAPRPRRVAYPEGAAVSLSEGGEGDAAAEERTVTALLREAETIAAAVSPREADDRLDRRLDRLLTGRRTARPLLLLFLAGLLWLTVVGANAPSRWLSERLFALEAPLAAGLKTLGAQPWLCALLTEGAYRVLAWVVAVMLPPMAIFFPLFALLEDAGFLPRVAYDLDRPFQRCRACGKQSLCMMMGLGCNAAGVTGCRIIASRRERLLAVLTNAMTPCNGRLPTLIALVSLFWVGAKGALGGALTALALVGLLTLSVGATFGMTWLLSHTLLRGESEPEVSELPPYRLPRVGRVLLRTLLDRILRVLGRAAAVAAPAGALIWLLGRWQVGGESVLSLAAAALEGPGRLLGMDGALLLAFLLGLPANEIVLPLALTVYAAGGTLGDPGSLGEIGQSLLAQGWTGWTAAAVIVFSMFHWPCSTTLLTVKKETGRWHWAALAAALPTAAGVLGCLALNALHSLIQTVF